jgi:hypothetical protein
MGCLSTLLIRLLQQQQGYKRRRKIREYVWEQVPQGADNEDEEDCADHRYAPEHYVVVQIHHPRPLGEKSDVWQIGAVMYWLLASGFEKSHLGPQRIHNGETEWICQPTALGPMDGPNADLELDDVLYPTLRRYARELKLICANAVTWDPDHRPTLLQMRTRIQAYLDTRPAMRDKAADRYLGRMVLNVDNDFVVGSVHPGRRYT